MDREKMIQHLEKRYLSKREILSRIPLGMEPDSLWQELLNRRRSRSITLPLTGCKGSPYWYVITPGMIAASEKIVETLYENEMDFDPYTESLPVTTLEEVFYTSYIEGSRITMQAAMEFLTGEGQPRDIEEQLITNNRLAGSYAGSNLYRRIDAALLEELIGILTEGMDGGSQAFRSEEPTDFASIDGEQLAFPLPHDIPSRMDEIEAFLSETQVHPLIKSAVVQAWMMLVRPFPEGNDRLGRILSSMILLRAGYTFFSEISLSALIARKSYGYYAAIDNILREENNGDLTYFIEFFMELLSRAVDERSLRRRKREEENRKAEMNLAHTPFAATQPGNKDTHPLPDGIVPATPLQKEYPSLPEQITEIVSDPKLDEDQDDTSLGIPNVCASPASEEMIMEQLHKYAEKPDKVLGQLSLFLLNRINEGNDHFCISEVTEAFNLIPTQLSSSIRHMKESGIITLAEKRNNQTFYKIEFGESMELARVKKNLEMAEEQGADPEMISLIRQLLASNKSTKDRRLGTMLALFWPKGQLSIDDYKERGDETKWAADMSLASRLGLVEKNDSGTFTILRHIRPGFPPLSKMQKKVIAEMYECFGDSIFSTEMVIATLDYSDSHVSAILHQFTLMKILDCHKEDVYKYQFLVNPEEHPQLFTNAA